MKKLLCLLLIALLLTGCALAEQPAVQQPLTLIAVNVGKADALLLQYSGLTYLVDTGTAESWGQLSAMFQALKLDHLNGVILTHTDKDHAGGAWALATSSIQVDAWYASRHFADVKEKKHPAVLAAALRGQEVNWLEGGDSLPFADGSLDVIGPLSYNEKENCNSVVLLAQASGGSMLLAGDMEFPEEEELLAAGLIPSCTVLKVGNHGESDASSDAFIYTVRPEIAVISTNTQEEPDTPAPRILKALYKVNTQVIQTQDTPSGVRVQIEDGKPTADSLSVNRPAPHTEIILSDKSIKDQTVTLLNTGTSPVDLSGWYLTSERGSETYVLPQGTVLSASHTLTISCLSSPHQSDLLWPESKVLHKSKPDPITLYDPYGQKISVLE